MNNTYSSWTYMDIFTFPLPEISHQYIYFFSSLKPPILSGDQREMSFLSTAPYSRADVSASAKVLRVDRVSRMVSRPCALLLG